MEWSDKDRRLGMDRPITRRHFMDGIAVAVGAMAAGKMGLLGGTSALAQGVEGAGLEYPPAATGLRGQTDTAQGVMHAVRDGRYWDQHPEITATGEHYDLVVVGSGISGLAAAVTYRRQAGADKKVLLIDPLEDFGGHAKRNEYTSASGKTLIGYGGSQSLDTPSFFSDAVHDLLGHVGINLQRFDDWFDTGWSSDRGLSRRTYFFAKEDWGQDVFVRRDGTTEEWVSQTPLSDKAKADLIKLIEEPEDYLAGQDLEERYNTLAGLTYDQFLTDYAKVDAEILKIYRPSSMGYFGVGTDAVSALDAYTLGLPGFDALELGDGVSPLMAPSGRLNMTGPDDYIHHFPEGNAGVARALVRSLIPHALPGETMEDLVLSKLDYGALDLPENDVRLRLNSTVIKVAHESADKVVVTYAGAGGAPFSVTADHVVLACWNRVIPYLTDELPEDQVAALNDQIKVPLIYANVQLKDWKAFDALKIDRFTALGAFWRSVSIDFPVSVGDYEFAQSPEDPVILHFSKVFVGEGATARDQFNAGRRKLQTLSWEELERSMRDILQRVLGEGGFDAARDIEAITINRWAHGYAYEYMRPWDAYWPDGPLPVETARKPFGRVAIANADSGAYAYCHSAIDQGVRAVRDLLGTPDGAPAIIPFPGPPREKIGL